MPDLPSLLYPTHGSPSAVFINSAEFVSKSGSSRKLHGGGRSKQSFDRWVEIGSWPFQKVFEHDATSTDVYKEF